MKKILISIVLLFLLSGCDMSKLTNTPTKQAELLFNKYQSLDSDVLKDLDDVVAEEESFNGEQREKYREVMKKNYQDLTYSVKDEEVDGDEATVTTEIEVYDFSKVLAEADLYLTNNPEEFKNSNGEYDSAKFMDYRLKKLSETKERVKYTLELTLIKKDDKWQLNKLTQTDQQKINGIYIY